MYVREAVCAFVMVLLHWLCEFGVCMYVFEEVLFYGGDVRVSY